MSVEVSVVNPSFISNVWYDDESPAFFDIRAMLAKMTLFVSVVPPFTYAGGSFLSSINQKNYSQFTEALRDVWSFESGSKVTTGKLVKKIFGRWFSGKSCFFGDGSKME